MHSAKNGSSPRGLDKGESKFTHLAKIQIVKAPSHFVKIFFYFMRFSDHQMSEYLAIYWGLL